MYVTYSTIQTIVAMSMQHYNYYNNQFTLELLFDNPGVKACTSLELTTYTMQVASREARALDSMMASCMCMCTIGTRLTQSRSCSYLPVVTNIYARHSWVQLAPYSVVCNPTA